MTEASLYRWLLLGWTAIAVVVFFVLLFVSAPYGRYRRDGWGPTMHRTAGWIVMESPAVWVVVLCLIVAGRSSAPALVLTALWLAHYVNRSLIYPLRLRGGQLRMPVAVAAMAFCFNLVNGYLQGRHLFGLSRYAADWLADPRFLIGAALFALGFVANLRADARLRALRGAGESGYRVPHGGLHRLVSCPNYLGEIVEWTGWAIACWSPAGAVFALWTAANLIPRALSHHRWYHDHFPDYPPARKALIPYLL